MWSRRRQSSIRARRRRAGHQVRRLRIESLEFRECPAVQAFFVGGVLSVVGDERNNVIELFQPRDRVMEVVGDGQTWVFEDVDEVIVDAGDGDDQATSSKPKEIVVVGAKIKMQMGAGNDTVRIDDGGATEEPLVADTPLEFAVDLGTGADHFSSQINHHVLVDALGVSADGGDCVEMEVRPGSRAINFYDIKNSVQLGGGGNEVKIVTENVGDVVLLYASLPGGGSADDGGNITLIAGSGLTPGRGGAGSNGGNITLVAHNGSGVEASLTVDMALSDGGDAIHSGTDGYKDGKLHLGGSFGSGEATLEFTAAEPDPAGANNRLYVGNLSMNSGSDVVGINLTGFPNVDLGLNADDGNDQVTIGVLFPDVQKVRPAAARIAMDLGGGGNVIDVGITNFDQVDLDLTTTGGANTVHGNIDLDNGYMSEDHPPYCAISLDFGGGGNLVDLNTQDFDQTSLNLRAAGGQNVVKHVLGHTIGLRHEHTRPEAQIDMDFGGGGNFVEVRMENYAGGLDLKVIAAPPPPISVTGGTINVYWHVITPPTSSSAGRDDGTLQMLILTPLQSSGVSSAQLNLVGSMGDAISPPSASLALDLGSTDDTVSILTDGVAGLDVGLNTGGGDDVVEIAADGPSNTLLVGERPPSRIAVDLGAGNDQLDLRTKELGNVDLDLTAGDGNDNVHTQNQVRTIPLWSMQGRTRLGPGDDRLLAEIEGYGNVDAFVDAGLGDDEVEVHALAATPAILLHRFSNNTVVDLEDGADKLSVETTGFAEVRQDLRGGGGNDIVLDDTAGGDDVQTAIDTGSGNDIAFVFTRIDTSSRQTTFVVEMALGPGSDLALLDSVGYSQISAAINTGPAGEGRDVVIASFRFSPLDRLRRIRRVADGGLDVFELFVAAGYDVQLDVSGPNLIATMNYRY